MDLSNLFVVKTPREETSVLIRLGRVMHYALSAIGWICITGAGIITLDFWREFGHPPAFLSGELVFVLAGTLSIMSGRGIRYVLSGE